MLFAAAIAITVSPRAAFPPLDRWLGAGTSVRVRTFVPCTLAALAAFVLMAPVIADGDAGQSGDWPINVALVHELLDAIEEGRRPLWVMDISTGDPVFELYPTLPHWIVALAAHAFGRHHVHAITMWLALAGYASVAAGVTRLALRWSAWPVAVLAGAAVAVEGGSVWTFGATGVWRWGLFPSTLALGAAVWGLSSLFDLRTDVRPSRMVRAWALYALALALHPIVLLITACVGAGIAVSACVGPKRERAGWARVLLHLGIAVLLMAWSWGPASARLLQYGVRFATMQVPLTLGLERMASGVLPEGAFPVAMTLAWVAAATAIAFGTASARVIALAALAVVALYLEPLFLDLGLSPTLASTRLQSYRVGALLVPLLYALVPAALSAPALAIDRLEHRPLRVGLRIAGGALACFALYAFGSHALERTRVHVAALRNEARHVELPDREGLRALESFFSQEVRSLPPGRFARAYYEAGGAGAHEILLVAQRARMPIAPRAEAMACFFFREQFATITPETLRRLGIRWAISRPGFEAPTAGAPDSERALGAFRVREVPEWDGSFGHVERGEGTLRFETISDHHLVVHLEGTDAPALASFATPYYPRWRARSRGAHVPTYAFPATPEPRVERLLAAWLPPGRTELAPDGPLPSDRAGWPLVLVGIALAALAWPWRGGHRAATLRARVRDLWARAEPHLLSPRALATGAVLFFGVVLARQGALGGSHEALRFGMFFPGATVHTISSGQREPCDPDPLGRRFECRDGTIVRMMIWPLLRDAEVGYAVPVPAIGVEPASASEIEVELPFRPSGRYLGACATTCRAELEVGGRTHAFAPGRTIAIEPDPTARRAIVRIHATQGDTAFGLVHDLAIDVDRSRDVPFAPEAPPREVSAITATP
jgi:hypothetical protein